MVRTCTLYFVFDTFLSLWNIFNACYTNSNKLLDLYIKLHRCVLQHIHRPQDCTWLNKTALPYCCWWATHVHRCLRVQNDGKVILNSMINIKQPFTIKTFSRALATRLQSYQIKYINTQKILNASSCMIKDVI